MLLFSRRKEQEVQGFMLRLVNNHCAELESLLEGPRVDGRVRLTIVVLVVPMVRKVPRVDQMFPAITKEFSTTGLSLVLHNPRAVDEMILGFRWESEMRFVLAKSRHLNPMGAGFFQMGLQTLELVNPGDYPELADLRF